MKIPTLPEQNYAMHLVAASLVELFPKFQLLDLTVYPDRSCIDFSFARELSIEELQLVKGRFFEKVKKGEQGDIREMVSKNACDLLKYHKQFFLTDLVDREEAFTDMLCMDVYNAPLVGEIEQGNSKILELKLDVFDLGEKKWMKLKVHHYRLEIFSFYSKEDRDEWDSLEAFPQGNLFWVDEGLKSFSARGEENFEEFTNSVSSFFGEKVYFDGEAEDFFKTSKSKDFFVLEEVEGNYDGISYGLKETELMRAMTVWSFSGKNLNDQMTNCLSSLGLEGELDSHGKFLVYDFKGIPWVVSEQVEENYYLSLEINLQCLYALSLEKKVK